MRSLKDKLIYDVCLSEMTYVGRMGFNTCHMLMRLNKSEKLFPEKKGFKVLE